MPLEAAKSVVQSQTNDYLVTLGFESNCGVREAGCLSALLSRKLLSQRVETEARGPAKLLHVHAHTQVAEGRSRLAATQHPDTHSAPVKM